LSHTIYSSVPHTYLNWCKQKINGFEIMSYNYQGEYMTYEKAQSMLTSAEYDEETGTSSGYTHFNSYELVPVTYHGDGSCTFHCGGPCGDLYVDENGNT